MAFEAAITAEAGWHRYEAKTIQITVYESDGSTPVDLSGLTSLQWLVLREPGSSTRLVDLNKDAGEITVSGASNNVANMAFEAADYASFPAGEYYHELWDRDNDLLLSYGSVTLLPGVAE